MWRRCTLSTALVLTLTSVSLADPFRRGNFNNDDDYDIADPVSTLVYLFLADGRPPCLSAGDANDDGTVDLSDALYSLGYLFLGGSAPPAPFPDCGEDQTPDDLGCERSRCFGEVPLISEALRNCSARVDNPPNSLRPGNAMHRVTLDDSTAICNDGSPAVMYLRPAAAGSPNIDRWVIYLQGGGGCSDFESCRGRWCRDENYDPSKMSSRFVPDTIAGTGIMRRSEENEFGDYNHVYFYYCSSDGWTGQKSHVVLTNDDDPSQSFRLHFRGHTILAKGLEALLDGGLVSDDNEVIMPSLGEAEFALISGFSAGSGGVLHNGDWFANQLEPNGTTVRLVRDASFSPNTDLIPDDDFRSEVEFALDEGQRARWEGELLNRFVDQSALAYYESLGTPWKTLDSAVVSHNFVTTPYFVHMDLLDRPTRERFEEFGITPGQVGTIVQRTLEDLPNMISDAIEGARMTRAPGVVGTRCGDHTGLMNDSVFFDRTVGEEGEERSYHDALAHWLAGHDVNIVDDLESSTTVCGPEQAQDE